MLIESKSIFAKLLATENIDVVHGPYKTASFHLKTRQLRLPIWNDAKTTDLFVGHEVSHALHTPLEGWLAALDAGMSKDLINVVEDIRIERLIQKRFPGLKRDFIRGYVRLMELDSLCPVRGSLIGSTSKQNAAIMWKLSSLLKRRHCSTCAIRLRRGVTLSKSVS